MIGAGKYDALCTAVRDQTQATEGVIVLVFGGEQGDGFSMQATLELTMNLPTILRDLANKIEKDAERLKQ